jgi:hypothetical protein
MPARWMAEESKSWPSKNAVRQRALWYREKAVDVDPTLGEAGQKERRGVRDTTALLAGSRSKPCNSHGDAAAGHLFE